MLLPYSLARPFLFRADPESVHDFTMDWLARGQNTPLQALWQQPRVQDPVQLASLSFPNRVGLAAGMDKDGRALRAWPALGFGFVVAAGPGHGRFLGCSKGEGYGARSDPSPLAGEGVARR